MAQKKKKEQTRKMHNDKEVKEDRERKPSSQSLFLSASLECLWVKKYLKLKLLMWQPNLPFIAIPIPVPSASFYWS